MKQILNYFDGIVIRWNEYHIRQRKLARKYGWTSWWTIRRWQEIEWLLLIFLLMLIAFAIWVLNAENLL